MKPVYLGAVRGYQPPVYRPGMGWAGSDTGRRSTRGPAVFGGRRFARTSPLTVVRRHRPGLRTKIAIIACVIVVAALLAIVLGGAAQL